MVLDGISLAIIGENESSSSPICKLSDLQRYLLAKYTSAIGAQMVGKYNHYLIYSKSIHVMEPMFDTNNVAKNLREYRSLKGNTY